MDTGRFGLAAVVAMAALAGCAGGERVELARRAQTELIGMPRAALLSCAGVPTRQATADGNEYFTYRSPVTSAGGGPSTSVGIGGGGGGVGVGVGLGIPLFGGGGGRGCEATFTLSGDVVRRLVYPAGTDLDDCGALLRNCLPPS